jgi:hypothetical protein
MAEASVTARPFTMSSAELPVSPRTRDPAALGVGLGEVLDEDVGDVPAGREDVVDEVVVFAAARMPPATAAGAAELELELAACL